MTPRERAEPHAVAARILELARTAASFDKKPLKYHVAHEKTRYFQYHWVTDDFRQRVESCIRFQLSRTLWSETER